MLQKSGSVNDRLRSICSYMELNLDEKMTIDNLCRRFYLSPTTSRNISAVSMISLSITGCCKNEWKKRVNFSTIRL